jgi:uncharacterized protein
MVSVDGTLSMPLNERLISLLIAETVDGLCRCELTFRNWQPSTDHYLYFDQALVDFNKAVKVQEGEGDSAPVLFEGKITGMEGRFPQTKPPEITILAEDALQPLRMTRRTRSFETMTDVAVIQKVIADHGLSADVSGPAEPQHACVVQMNQTDLAFIRERARIIGAEIWADGQKVLVKPRKERSAGSLTLAYGETLLEFSVLADLTGQRSKVVVTGWDPVTKEPIKAEATSSVTDAERGSLKAGGSLLAGERVEQLVHTMSVTDAEAKAIAEATYLRLARRFVTGTGLAAGDSRIKVGTKLTLKGVGPLFAGDYAVTEIRHTYSEQDGFLTQFRVERTGIGA